MFPICFAIYLAVGGILSGASLHQQEVEEDVVRYIRSEWDPTYGEEPWAEWRKTVYFLIAATLWLPLLLFGAGATLCSPRHTEECPELRDLAAAHYESTRLMMDLEDGTYWRRIAGETTG